MYKRDISNIRQDFAFRCRVDIFSRIRQKYTKIQKALFAKFLLLR